MKPNDWSKSLWLRHTDAHVYTQRFTTEKWPQRETDLGLLMFNALLLHCYTHHLQYVLCFFVCIQDISLLYVCLCESNALCKAERRQLPRGLRPNMVLFRPRYSYLIGFQQRCHYKVQRSTVIAWLGGRASVSVCLSLRLTVVVYDNRMKRKMRPSNRRAEHVKAEERQWLGRNLLVKETEKKDKKGLVI